MAPFDPLGPTELARRWGVSRQRLLQILDADPRLGRLSKPLARGRVWNLEDIEAYEQEAGREPRGATDDT